MIMAMFRSCETAPVEAADQTERRADHEGDKDGERAANRAGAAAVQQPGQDVPADADADAAEQRRGAARLTATTRQRTTRQPTATGSRRVRRR
jgi:hypothetical protein